MNSTECVLPTYDVLTNEQIRKINANSFIVKHTKSEYIFSQDKAKISFDVPFYRSGENI